MKTHSLIVSKITDETADAYTLHFQTQEPSLLNYKSGQYLTLKLKIDGTDVRRAFSLSSAPGVDTDLSITIKRVAGGKASNFLRDTLKAGDAVEVFPPMGNFCIETDSQNKKHYILIGAGSGITPLMSMVKSVLHKEPQSKVTLWYGNRNLDTVIFYAELEKMKQTYGDRCNVIHVLSRASGSTQAHEGRLDKHKVESLLSDLFMKDEYRKVYYLCGPNGMMEDAIAALHAQGVNPTDIHREYYSAPAPTDEEVAAVHGEKPKGEENVITLILDGKSYEVPVKPDQYILDAAIDMGIDPPYACQSGICTTCRAKLSSGEVKMDCDEGLTDYEMDQGYVLTCQSLCVKGKVVVEYM